MISLKLVVGYVLHGLIVPLPHFFHFFLTESFHRVFIVSYFFHPILCQEYAEAFETGRFKFFYIFLCIIGFSILLFVCCWFFFVIVLVDCFVVVVVLKWRDSLAQKPILTKSGMIVI